MERKSYVEICEYTYVDEEERGNHIEMMLMEGWRVSPKQMELKSGRNLMTTTDEDYEWYAKFFKEHK